MHTGFLFAGVEQQVVKTLTAGVQAEQFLGGELIYGADKFYPAVGQLLCGEATVTQGGVQLNRLSAGSYFGVTALYQSENGFITTIRAKTNCTVVFFQKEQLEAMFYAHPQIAVNYIRFLSDRILFLNHKIRAFTLSSTEQAVALFLLEYGADTVLVPGGYAALAGQVGVSRASLYRGLQKLEEAGTIGRTRKTITIKNRKQLALLLQGGHTAV